MAQKDLHRPTAERQKPADSSGSASKNGHWPTSPPVRDHAESPPGRAAAWGQNQAGQSPRSWRSAPSSGVPDCYSAADSTVARPPPACRPSKHRHPRPNCCPAPSILPCCSDPTTNSANASASPRWPNCPVSSPAIDQRLSDHCRPGQRTWHMPRPRRSSCLHPADQSPAPARQ